MEGGGGMHVHPMYPLLMSPVAQRIRSNPHLVTCPWRGGMHVHPMYPLLMSPVAQRIRSNPHLVTCPWRGGMHVHPMYPLPMSPVTQRIRSNPHLVTCPWRGGDACASHVPPCLWVRWPSASGQTHTLLLAHGGGGCMCIPCTPLLMSPVTQRIRSNPHLVTCPWRGGGDACASHVPPAYESCDPAHQVKPTPCYLPMEGGDACASHVPPCLWVRWPSARIRSNAHLVTCPWRGGGGGGGGGCMCIPCTPCLWVRWPSASGQTHTLWLAHGGGGMHVHPMYPLPTSPVAQRIRSNPHLVTCPWRGGDACASHVPPAHESGDPAHQVKPTPCYLPPAYESGDPAHQVKPTPCYLPMEGGDACASHVPPCLWVRWPSASGQTHTLLLAHGGGGFMCIPRTPCLWVRWPSASGQTHTLWLAWGKDTKIVICVEVLHFHNFVIWWLLVTLALWVSRGGWSGTVQRVENSEGGG